MIIVSEENLSRSASERKLFEKLGSYCLNPKLIGKLLLNSLIKTFFNLTLSTELFEAEKSNFSSLEMIKIRLIFGKLKETMVTQILI